MNLNKVDSNYLSIFKGLAISGGVTIAWRFLLPSTVLGSLGTIATGILGTAITYGIGSTLYNSFYKKYHRSAAPLNLTDNLTIFDKEFRNAFSKIQSHQAYPLLAEKEGLKDDHSGLNFFKAALSRGTCSGEMVEILRVMRSSPNLSCQEILARTDKENIFYNQMLHQMRASLELAAKQEELHSVSFRSMFSHLATKEIESGYQSKISKFEDAVKMIDTELSPASENTCRIRVSASSFDYKLQEIEKAFKRKLDGEKIIGSISMTTEITEKIGESSYHVYHTIPFQYSSGSCRFYDPVNAGEGFFEYPDPTSFFNAVKKQAVSNFGHNAKIVFTLKK